MPDKIMTEFIDPQWIKELKDKRITNEKLAEIIGKSKEGVSNLLNQKNNPSPKSRNAISEAFNISFESINIKDLILTISHISDKKISSNCKRVLLLLLLFRGKAPGASIKVAKLKEEGYNYGYGDKEIDEAIEKLENKGLINLQNDNVNLVFGGIKKVYAEYQQVIKKKRKKVF